MIMPYINFKGKCEEAFLWYAEVLGGEIQHLVKYESVPKEIDMGITEDQKSWVMHAQLLIPNIGNISGADALWEVKDGSMISLHVHLPSQEKADAIFSKLSKKGVIISPLLSNPPPDDDGVSGSIKDAYGITWIISALKDI